MNLTERMAYYRISGVIEYKQGEELPNLIQILNGESPANTPPINVDRVPGTKYRYSGDGYLIVQQMLIDLFNSKKTFPEIVDETVFNPIHMSKSYFGNVPLEKIKITATAYRNDGNPIPGKWFNYPETGMGVFWTTSTDMAKFISEIMHLTDN